NTLWSHTFFLGIPEFYRGVARDNCAPIDVVSGGDAKLDGFTERDLDYNNVPYEFIAERPNLQISIYDFKMEQFQAVHATRPGYVVALGDDTQTDDSVMADSMAKFPRWISAGYIHVVTGRQLRAGVTPYYS